MIKDLLNTELKDLPIKGLTIHLIKKYIVKTSSRESFTVKNLSVLLIKSGKLKIKLQETTKHLSTRDLIIIPKDSFCTLLEIQDKLQLFLISFSSEFAFENSLRKELLESFYFILGKTPMKVTLEEKEFSVLSLIYKLIYFISKDIKPNGFDLELQRASFNLFLYKLKFIYSKHAPEKFLNFSRKESIVIQFLTMLSIHIKKQHNVKFYADSLFVTSGYLYHTVKNVTGKTVKKIIAEAIVIHAKTLLEESQFSIVEIAEELGFQSTSNFSFFFKKHTSFSPSQYRSSTMGTYKSQ